MFWDTYSIEHKRIANIRDNYAQVNGAKRYGHIWVINYCKYTIY